MTFVIVNAVNIVADRLPLRVLIDRHGNERQLRLRQLPGIRIGQERDIVDIDRFLVLLRCSLDDKAVEKSEIKAEIGQADRYFRPLTGRQGAIREYLVQIKRTERLIAVVKMEQQLLAAGAAPMEPEPNAVIIFHGLLGLAGYPYAVPAVRLELDRAAAASGLLRIGEVLFVPTVVMEACGKRFIVHLLRLNFRNLYEPIGRKIFVSCRNLRNARLQRNQFAAFNGQKLRLVNRPLCVARHDSRVTRLQKCLSLNLTVLSRQHDQTRLIDSELKHSSLRRLSRSNRDVVQIKRRLLTRLQASQTNAVEQAVLQPQLGQIHLDQRPLPCGYAVRQPVFQRTLERCSASGSQRQLHFLSACGTSVHPQSQLLVRIDRQQLRAVQVQRSVAVRGKANRTRTRPFDRAIRKVDLAPTVVRYRIRQLVVVQVKSFNRLDRISRLFIAWIFIARIFIAWPLTRFSSRISARLLASALAGKRDIVQEQRLLLPCTPNQDAVHPSLHAGFVKRNRHFHPFPGRYTVRQQIGGVKLRKRLPAKRERQLKRLSPLAASAQPEAEIIILPRIHNAILVQIDGLPFLGFEPNRTAPFIHRPRLVQADARPAVVVKRFLQLIVEYAQLIDLRAEGSRTRNRQLSKQHRRRQQDSHLGAALSFHACPH